MSHERPSYSLEKGKAYREQNVYIAETVFGVHQKSYSSLDLFESPEQICRASVI